VVPKSAPTRPPATPREEIVGSAGAPWLRWFDPAEGRRRKDRTGWSRGAGRAADGPDMKTAPHRGGTPSAQADQLPSFTTTRR